MAKVFFKQGDDISTDVIYPGRYMATVLPTETPQYAFVDDAEVNAKLKAKQVPPGSVLVAGKNFGCGSSREQACSCLKGYELTIVARGFARIFLQNSINLGLDLITAPDIEASEGDESRSWRTRWSTRPRARPSRRSRCRRPARPSSTQAA